MSWLLFQLFFDIVLFALIIYLVLQSSKNRPVKPEDFRALLNEFREAVDRGEKIARELDRQLRARGGGADSPAVTPPPKVRPVAAEPAAKSHPADENEKHSGPVPGNKIEEQKRKVAALHKHGLQKEEISKRLAIPLPEVELIVAMLEAGE